jgi:hypothetical protein
MAPDWLVFLAIGIPVSSVIVDAVAIARDLLR